MTLVAELEDQQRDAGSAEPSTGLASHTKELRLRHRHGRGVSKCCGGSWLLW
jgi:hypothetical protein